MNAADLESLYGVDSAPTRPQNKLTKRKRTASFGGEDVRNSVSLHFSLFLLMPRTAFRSQMSDVLSAAFAAMPHSTHVPPTPLYEHQEIAPPEMGFFPDFPELGRVPGAGTDAELLPVDEFGFSMAPQDISSADLGFATAPDLAVAESVSAAEMSVETYLASVFGQTQQPQPQQSQQLSQPPVPDFGIPPPRQHRSKSFSAWEDRNASSRYRGDPSGDLYPSASTFFDALGLHGYEHPAASASSSASQLPAPLQLNASTPVPGSIHDASKAQHHYMSYTGQFPQLQPDIQPSSSSDDGEEGDSAEDHSQDSFEVKKPQRKKAKGPNGEPLPRVKRVPYVRSSFQH